MDKKYTYDAFISYRHTELDKFVAENLHKAMETFKPPKSILKSGKSKRTRIERVFRDRDELPLASNLEDPIVTALEQSEYLIVICSPRLKESMWCKKEIETFIGFHGRNNILAVLVEGEPDESFPEELLYVEEEVQNPDGTSEIRRRNIEPLAADVRGNSKKEILKAIKSELLRLLAPMFAVSYDDLRQRHRERRMKRIVATSVAGSVVCLLIGAGSTIAALQIKKQKEQIEQQAKEISAQAGEIQSQNNRLLENQAKNLAEKSLDMLEKGDRLGAVQTAGWALTEYEGIAMPYTPEAKYALTESMHVYDSENVQKAQYQMVTSGIIEFLEVSPDRKTVVTFDQTNSLCIWDVASGQMIDSVNDIDTLFHEGQFSYIDSDRFAYVSNDDSVHIYQISAKAVSGTIPEGSASLLSSDMAGKYLGVCGWGQYKVYDMTTMQLLYTLPAENKNSVNIKCFVASDNTMVCVEQLQKTDGDDDTDTAQGDIVKLSYVNMADGTVYASQTIDYDYITDIYFMGQRAYLIGNNIVRGRQERESGVIACNMADGTVIWEHKWPEKIISGIELPHLETASKLIAYAYGEVYLLDVDTGKESARYAVNSNIAGSGKFRDSGDFMIFTQSGDFSRVYENGDDLLTMNYIFECKSQNVSDFKVADGYFLVLPYNDNRITAYCASKNPDMQPYEGELVPDADDGGQDGNIQEDIVAEARKLGLEKAALATGILYSQDKAVMFVSYSDDTLEIYNAADMTLLHTINDLKCDMTRYLGTDKEGNTYIAGLTYGYCLDSSYMPTAKIEKLLMLDSENNRLIVGTGENLYTIPIYTTEELLGMIPENIAPGVN